MTQNSRDNTGGWAVSKHSKGAYNPPLESKDPTQYNKDYLTSIYKIREPAPPNDLLGKIPPPRGESDVFGYHTARIPQLTGQLAYKFNANYLKGAPSLQFSSPAPNGTPLSVPVVEKPILSIKAEVIEKLAKTAKYLMMLFDHKGNKEKSAHFDYVHRALLGFYHILLSGTRMLNEVERADLQKYNTEINKVLKEKPRDEEDDGDDYEEYDGEDERQYIIRRYGLDIKIPGEKEEFFRIRNKEKEDDKYDEREAVIEQYGSDLTDPATLQEYIKKKKRDEGDEGDEEEEDEVEEVDAFGYEEGGGGGKYEGDTQQFSQTQKELANQAVEPFKDPNQASSSIFEVNEPIPAQEDVLIRPKDEDLNRPEDLFALDEKNPPVEPEFINPLPEVPTKRLKVAGYESEVVDGDTYRIEKHNKPIRKYLLGLPSHKKIVNSETTQVIKAQTAINHLNSGNYLLDLKNLRIFNKKSLDEQTEATETLQALVRASNAKTIAEKKKSVALKLQKKHKNKK